MGEDLEQVEVMQKKFDDFQADLKANEVRLAEMNEIAMQLMSLGQTEAALKIQTQIEVSCIVGLSDGAGSYFVIICKNMIGKRASRHKWIHLFWCVGNTDVHKGSAR